MIKRILSILVVAVISVGLIACGGEVKSAKKENEKQQVYKEGNIRDKHINVLESSNTYEEMTSKERTAAVEITEDYWEELSDEQKEKYKDRKEFIEKTKAEAVEKWKKEESKNTNRVNKEDLKLKVENVVPQNVKGKSYVVDVLTPTKGEGYNLSIQLDNKELTNEEVCKKVAMEILSKLKGIDGINSIKIKFISNMNIIGRLDIKDGNKIRDGIIENIEIKKS